MRNHCGTWHCMGDHALDKPSQAQIEFKCFPSITRRYLLVFDDVALYKIGSLLPCSRMLWKLKITSILVQLIVDWFNHEANIPFFTFSIEFVCMLLS